jgi:hypothetical protein
VHILIALQDFANLPHLKCLHPSRPVLQVDVLGAAPEYHVTSSRLPLDKAEPQQKIAHVIKSNICIASSAEHLLQNLIVSAHHTFDA